MTTYFCSPDGSDSNDGVDGRPVRSAARAASLVKDASSDELRFRAGGVWAESLGTWNKSGVHVAAPIILGSYGDGPKPLFKPPVGPVMIHTGDQRLRNLRLDGLHFDAYDLSRVGYKNAGLHLANCEGIEVLNSRIRGFAMNVVVANGDNVKFRGNAILDAHATERHSQGLYAEGVTRLGLFDNVFDRNGWREGVALQTIFNHNVYITAGCGPAMVTGNVFSRGSATGVQARSGGVIENNLFYRNPIGLTYGLVFGGSGPKAGGVSGRIAGNTFLEGSDIGTSPRRTCVDVANIGPEGVVVERNCFGAGIDEAFGSAGLGIHVGNGIGVHRLMVKGNSFFGDSGMSFGSSLRNTITNTPLLGVVDIAANAFRCSGAFGFHEEADGYAFDASKLRLRGNRHFAPLSAKFVRLWGERGTKVLDEAAWKALTKDDAEVLG